MNKLEDKMSFNIDRLEKESDICWMRLAMAGQQSIIRASEHYGVRRIFQHLLWDHGWLGLGLFCDNYCGSIDCFLSFLLASDALHFLECR